MKVFMKHPQTNMLKRVKVGFSWTVFFFGFFPALFRGDWKWAIIMFLAASFTFGVSNFVFMFMYNKLYINDLLEKGFVAADETAENILSSKGLILKSKKAA